MLDIFRSDAFSVVSLTDFINNLKFVPGYIGSTGIFDEQPINTTSVVIENDNMMLRLVPPTPRGGPGVTLDKPKRGLRMLGVPHFEINDAVMAEEVQGIRAWGQQTGSDAVMAFVGRRLQTAGQSLSATHEFSRIGAIKGIITYADGSTTNLFDEFGVTQPTEVDFNLDAASPVGGILRQQCAAVTRLMAANLEGQPVSGIGALVGDAFYDALIMHPEVRATYLASAAATELRNGYVNNGNTGTYGSFNFGGIEWINYRGSLNGTAYINTDKAHFFPMGVPGLFKSYVAPADYIETVNTMGQMRYVKQYEMPNGKGVHMDTQTNVLHICTRPLALIQGKRT